MIYFIFTQDSHLCSFRLTARETELYAHKIEYYYIVGPVKNGMKVPKCTESCKVSKFVIYYRNNFSKICTEM